MIGWMPTAEDITRGTTMLLTTNQPMPMTIRTGKTTSGLVSTATTTGGIHETIGPKNGIAWSTPTRRGCRGQEIEAEGEAGRRRRWQPKTTPCMAWPRMNPPNEVETLFSNSRAGSDVARRNEPVDVGQDAVLVENDEQRQEDDQQQVADDAQAEQGQVGQRLDQRVAEIAQAG